MEVSLFYNGTPEKSFEHSGAYSKTAITLPGSSGKFVCRLSVPILDMHGYWTPELRIPAQKIVWNIKATSAGQRDFPFLTFFNSANLNRFAIGTTNLVDDTEITARMNQENCTYDITLTVALTENSTGFDLIIDQREQSWTQTLADWRNQLALPPNNFPSGAWEPVYCTWYAVHAAVTQDWVEKNAEIASALGFKTLIIDDGWCFDEMKRVSPETIGSWYELIGDWQMSESKFPDFDAHRKRVQAMGMQYVLWVTPFLIGVKSELFQQIKDCVYPEYNEGCHVFDSSNAAAAQKIHTLLQNVMVKYRLDGLKIDFLDYILPDVNSPRGNVTTEFIAGLTRSIREAKPDALIEFRQSYATPGMLQYATQFRAGDVPFDFIDNFNRLCQIRISIGDNVPVHADPMYWHPRESMVNISRHLIASLVGVPMLSMDLLKLSDMEKAVLNFWLKFYNTHRQTLNHGTWEIHYRNGSVAYAMAKSADDCVIIVNESRSLESALQKSSGTAYICNLSADEILLDGASSFSGDGTMAADGTVPAGGMGVYKR